MTTQKWLLRTYINTATVEEVEFVKETPKCVFVLPKSWHNPLRVLKSSEHELLFDTQQEAHAAGVSHLEAQLSHAHKVVQDAEEALTEFKALAPTTATTGAAA